MVCSTEQFSRIFCIFAFNLQQYSTILTVPNLLTMLRMVLAPVLGYLVLQEAYTPACAVFVVAGLTDMVS